MGCGASSDALKFADTAPQSVQSVVGGAGESVGKRIHVVGFVRTGHAVVATPFGNLQGAVVKVAAYHAYDRVHLFVAKDACPFSVVDGDAEIFVDVPREDMWVTRLGAGVGGPRPRHTTSNAKRGVN